MVALNKPKYYQIVDVILQPTLKENGIKTDWTNNSDFMIGLRQASLMHCHLPEHVDLILNTLDLISNTSEDYKDGFRTMIKSIERQEAFRP